MTMKKALRATLLTTALVSLGSIVMADGTAPGVNISNSIDVSYTSGSTTITRTGESTVSFVVDRKVDFIIEGQDASSTVTVGQDAVDQQLTFRLENEGNDTSGYDITISTSGNIGLTLDAAGGGAAGTYSIYIGPNPGAYDSGSDTLYDPSGTINIGDIAADGVAYVKILAHIPATAIDGQSDDFTVTATALDAGTNTPTVETNSPSISVMDTFLADTDRDGIEFDTESYVLSAPMMAASKTSSVISENLTGTFDCANGANVAADEAFVPGACIEYVLRVENGATASSAATNVALVDTLPAEVTYVSTFSNVGFDSVIESGGAITATVATLAPGAFAETRIRVTID